MAPLRRLRQLLRIAEQHELRRRAAHREHVGQRLLAGLVDEQHVDRVRPCPRAPTTTAVPAITSNSQSRRPRPRPRRCSARQVTKSAAQRWWSSAFCSALDPTPSRGALADRVDQVADHRVAVGGDPDALAVAHQPDDELGALGRLPRAGRTLDGEVGLGELGAAWGRGACAAAGRARRGTGPGASMPCAITCSAMRRRACSCASVGTGGPGISACGCGPAMSDGPRFRSIQPATSSMRHDLAGAALRSAARTACRPTLNLWSCGVNA